MRALLFLCACALCALTTGFLAAAPEPAPAASRAPGPRAETGTGFVDVSSEPSGARILVDDADTGLTTPQHSLAVRSGHHQLTLVPADAAYKKLTVGFTAEAGQTKKLTMHLLKSGG